MTGEACTDIGQIPGAGTKVADKQVYQITSSTKRCIDPAKSIVVKNGTDVVATTDYVLLPLSGTILFREALSSSPTITVDANYLAAATGTDVVGVQHVNNWQLGLTANEIDLDEYGQDLVVSVPGKMGGSFQFDSHGSSSRVDIITRMLLQQALVFEFWEELQTRRRWRGYGRLGGAPLNAPSAGAVSGTVTGRLLCMPSFIDD